MEKLVDKGLVRSIGVSNFTIEQLTRLLNAPGIKYRPSYIQVCSTRNITITETIGSARTKVLDQLKGPVGCIIF